MTSAEKRVLHKKMKEANKPKFFPDGPSEKKDLEPYLSLKKYHDEKHCKCGKFN